MMCELQNPLTRSTLPISILLCLLEPFVEYEFLCPCRAAWNAYLSNLIFATPAVFTFTIMVIILRPCKHKCIFSCKRQSEAVNVSSNRPSVYSMYLICLIPPLLWISLLLYDGDYIACSKTDWNGIYVYDDEVHIKWCKPTGLNTGSNETQLRDLTQDFIAESQHTAYVLLLVISTITFFCVCMCDTVRKCICPQEEKQRLKVYPPKNKNSVISSPSCSLKTV